MENVTEFIKPELLVLIPVIYFLGLMLKNTKKIKDEYIPLILGCVGIVLSIIYVLGTYGFSFTGLFTAITQGVLVSGAAVYVNQLIKQLTSSQS